jgi:putative Ca2+/H+ antiporter (TMEM165/GDT1 family)
VVAVGEIGDLTQVITADLSARYHDPVSVFIGALCGLWLVSAGGVLAGRNMVRVVPLAVVRKAGGMILLALAIYSVIGALK